MFEMKNKNESIRKHWIPELFTKKLKKRPFNYSTIKLVNREFF